MNKPFEYIRIDVHGCSRIPMDKRSERFYYFELRTYGPGARYTYIERHVYVNNEGSLIADRDILADASQIAGEEVDCVDYDDLFKMYQHVVHYPFWK